jgi:hypothetical protein
MGHPQVLEWETLEEGPKSTALSRLRTSKSDCATGTQAETRSSKEKQREAKRSKEKQREAKRSKEGNSGGGAIF